MPAILEGCEAPSGLASNEWDGNLRFPSQYSIILYYSKYYTARPFGPRFNIGKGRNQTFKLSSLKVYLIPSPLKDGTRRVPSNII